VPVYNTELGALRCRCRIISCRTIFSRTDKIMTIRQNVTPVGLFFFWVGIEPNLLQISWVRQWPNGVLKTESAVLEMDAMTTTPCARVAT
jgi:hypothetical protein